MKHLRDILVSAFLLGWIVGGCDGLDSGPIWDDEGAPACLSCEIENYAWVSGDKELLLKSGTYIYGRRGSLILAGREGRWSLEGTTLAVEDDRCVDLYGNGQPLEGKYTVAIDDLSMTLTEVNEPCGHRRLFLIDTWRKAETTSL